MDTLGRTALWQQFGAAIDMLANTLSDCPPSLWNACLWRDQTDPALPPASAEFWYIAYHTLFWLDLYLSGSLAGFVPPAPFTLDELDPGGVLPARTYTKEELQAYLAFGRQKCQTTIALLTDEQAQGLIDFPWARGKAVSFYELLLYTMRHVQEHASQLHLLLGQHGIQVTPDWVTRASHEAGSV